MAYKKVLIILSVLSVMLVLIFFIVSCALKASGAQNMTTESQTVDAAVTDALGATSPDPSTSPDSSASANSTDDSGSQSNSSSGDSLDDGNKQTPEISVVSILTTDGARSGILLISEGGVKISGLTNGIYNNSGPVFSPDKKKIAFYSNIEGNYDIYTINPDGTGLNNITSNDAGAEDFVPQWSPDGNKICYQSDQSGNSGIYITKADGSQKFEVVQNRSENYSPVWFPDGSKILYVSNEGGNFDIYLIGTDGSGKKKLTEDEYYEQDLFFSPDGSKVLYAAGLIDSTAFEIFTLDIKTLKINKLTDNMSYSRLPLWGQGQDTSQNGSRIIFNSDMDGYSEIYSINIDGSGLTNLTNNEVEDYLIGLSSDGSAVFYQTTDENGDANLDMYNLNNSLKTTILGGRAEYDILREKVTSPLKLFEFIDLNIIIAVPSFADEITGFAIEFSENELIPFSDEYYKESIQEKIWSEHDGTTNLEVLAVSRDKLIGELAQKTLDRKFKLVSTEGQVFPIVDYMAYKKLYSSYLSEQMRAYIDIMAAESEKPSISDAGLTISLDEYVERIMSLYDFEEKYEGFARIYRIANMLNGSLWVYMGGIDNSPVFKSSGNIVPQRLEDFKANAEKYEGTRFGNKLTEYLDLLKAENYKRTEKVSDYIDNLAFY